MTFNKNQIKLLESIGINALILVGSQAQGIASKTSDFDFLILGPKSAKAYDALYDLLSEKINKLVDIDIVFESDASMELKSHAVKYGLVLYEKKSNIFANFKEHVIIDYADFAYLRKIFQEATLSRIP